MNYARKRIGEVLVEHGVISQNQLAEALAEQSGRTGPNRRLGRLVVEMGFATEKEVAEALGEVLGLPVVDLAHLRVPAETVRILPRQVSERDRVVVIDKHDDGSLSVAASDPTNVVALDDVRLYTGVPDLRLLVATEGQISHLLGRAWSLSQDLDEATSLLEEPEDPFAAVDLEAAEDGPTVRLVNRILTDAVRQRASDVHIEPQRDSVQVRFRVDGELRREMTLPRGAGPSMISRIKIVSGLDIAERRVPQDGRTRINADHASIDARVSTLPSQYGEKVVIRLLTGAESIAPLDELGFEPRDLAGFRRALDAAQGLILITGPTGSGKTNTLYSAIKQISRPQINIVTLEDPVEVQLDGITQVQVNRRTGMTFAAGLRSILRQDPDIVLVGEIRDTETAELALQASLTGHLVLATLHTNSAVAALTRLVDMGIEPFLIASSLTAVVAQRLVRRPCPSCREPYQPAAEVLARLGIFGPDVPDATPIRGAGCVECSGTGFRGRTGIFEVLEIDAALRSVLTTSPTESAVAAAARASGMTTLRAAGLLKARRGGTTYEEAARVTHTDQVSGRHCATCDRPVTNDMVVCPWCETVLDAGSCRHCARHLEPGWVVCPWCRTRVGSLPTVH